MPFPNAELRIPAEYEDAMDMFTRTRPSGGERPDPEDAPFPRQVDLWFLAVCVGALEDKRTPLPANRSHKFNTGSIFESDAARIEILELLAIAATDDPYVIREPRRVIDIANEFAAGGLPTVMQMLTDRGHATAMDSVSEQVQKLIADALVQVPAD